MKNLALLLLFGITLAFACTKNPYVLNEPVTCQAPAFSKRLKKTVTTTTYPGTIFLPSTSSTEYFFDAQQRIDRIQNGKYATKIEYSSDNRVDKVINYYYDSDKVGQVSHYFYDNGNITKTVSDHYDQSGNLQPYHSICYYTWTNQGYLESHWFEGSNDKTVYSLDDCRV